MIRGSLLPPRSLRPRSFHHASPSPSPRLSTVHAQFLFFGKAVAPGGRAFSLGPQRLVQDAKAFTRYPLPKAIRIDKASDMTTDKLKRARTAYIALGSNLRDRIAEIETACREMDARGIRVTRTSSLWESEPMYYVDQNRFVNGVCEVQTTLEPLELLDQLQDIETTMGRHKVIDKGPRNIDLDILLYEDLLVKHQRLNIPHLAIPEREFVLRPLAELIPTKAIYPSSPWKFTQDYLNDLPPSNPPLTTLTPLSAHQHPLQALKSSRKTHIMAILNMTPDSFSDGGIHTPTTLAATIRAHIAAGATIFDVGGQSTAPHAPQVSPEDELARVLPAIAAIRALPEATHIPISVDTYRATVAEHALDAGADMVNDVSAGALDAPAMLATVARLGATVCLMHMRGTPATMSGLNDYAEDGAGGGGLIPTIARELLASVAAAEAAGVRRWRIILDPGIGFAKDGAQNVALLRGLRELREWPGLEGLPWLVGASRKSFIGKITGVTTPAERIWGTAAAVAAAVEGGADVVRVHDVKEMGQVVKMCDAIWRY